MTKVKAIKQKKLQEKLKEKELELAKLKEELRKTKEKLLRSYADYQNYQKRVEKEIKEKTEKAKEDLLLQILDLYENLNLAYNDKSPKKAIRIIIKNIEKLIEKEKIKPIETIGKKFDHNLHHAISTIEKNDVEDGVIIDEIKKGYLRGDRILRPSIVVVAKNSKK